MTDRDIMLHRFSNIRKSTGELAKYLGISKIEYEEACKRAMDEEAKEFNRINGAEKICIDEVSKCNSKLFEKKSDACDYVQSLVDQGYNIQDIGYQMIDKRYNIFTLCVLI